jgi:UDP-glucose 4-epimerase
VTGKRGLHQGAGVPDRMAVIGAGGFLGSAVVTAAREAGVPVDPYGRADPALCPDGTADPRLARARTVFWLASSVNPALAEAHPERVRADLAAFRALLRAARRLPRPPRVVLLSSGGAVYDPAAPPPYRETSPTGPRGAYGRVKLAMEDALADSGLPGTALRVSNLYGPGQPAASGQGVVGHWLRAAAAGRNLTVYGDPGTTRDYVYAADVAGALLAVHAAPAVPPVVNLGSGRPTSLRELAELLLAAIGDPALRLELHPARGFDVPHTWLDVGLAASALGWTATTPLEAGLARCWGAVPVPA